MDFTWQVFISFIQILLEGNKGKVNSTYSSWVEIFFSVPQGSILEPLLFNMYTFDVFYDVNDLEHASFADNNTASTCSPDIIFILETLKKGIDKVFEWFSQNLLNINADVTLWTGSQVPVDLQVSNITLMWENMAKPLGIHIHNTSNFDFYVSKLCK